MIYLKFSFTLFLFFQIESYSSIKGICIAWGNGNLVGILTTHPPNIRFRLQKTSSRRLDQDENICLSHTSSQDVFKTYSRRLAKLSSRCFQGVSLSDKNFSSFGLLLYYTLLSTAPFSGVLTEAYLESGRTSTMEFFYFSEILSSFKVLTIFSKKAPRLGWK